MNNATVTPEVKPAAQIASRPAAPPHPLREFWGYFSQNRGAVIGLAIIIAMVLAALFADVIAPHSPIEQFRQSTLVPPVSQAGGSSHFLLGTDPVVRDMLLGLLAGYFRGLVEVAIMRLMDIMLALPSLLLAIAVVAILGPGLMNAMYAIAVVMLPHYARQTRAAVIGEMSRDYVSASRIAGAGTLRIMFNCVLPNCLAPLIVQATLGFSSAILDAAALGFLGMGAQPPTPEWGSMLASAMEFIQSAWWVVAFPGLAILISVLAFNLMGDGLRDALDPKLKR